MAFSKVIAFFVLFEFHEIMFGGKMQHAGILYLTQIHKTKILKEIIVFCAKNVDFPPILRINVFKILHTNL